MNATRRALLTMGMAGLVFPQAALTRSYGRTNKEFKAWRQEFEASVPARMAKARIAGVSMAIMSRNYPAFYAASFGFADIAKGRALTTNTPMHMASVSKLFTASSLVQLFERKGYDLDDDINKFIDLRVRNPHHPKIAVTPRQILTHTSSISDEGYGGPSFAGDPTQSLSEFLREYLVEGGRTFARDYSYYLSKPGARWEYSNVAMALAGYVVESVSGQGFASYVEQNLLKPLGIGNAHWYLKQFASDVLAKPYEFVNGKFTEMPQQGYPDVPAGMLRISVSDLAMALCAMIGGETGRPAILSDDAVKEMLRRQVDPGIIAYQGLGWTSEEIGGHAYIGHSGRDFGAANMVVLTEDQSHAVIVLINTEILDAGRELRFELTKELLAGAMLAT